MNVYIVVVDQCSAFSLRLMALQSSTHTSRYDAAWCFQWVESNLQTFSFPSFWNRNIGTWIYNDT